MDVYVMGKMLMCRCLFRVRFIVIC